MVLFAFYGVLVSLFVKFLDSLAKLIMSLFAVILTTILTVTMFGTTLNADKGFSIAFIVIGAVIFKLGTVEKKRRGE